LLTYAAKELLVPILTGGVGLGGGFGAGYGIGKRKK
jgi:hypothetical protein